MSEIINELLKAKIYLKGIFKLHAIHMILMFLAVFMISPFILFFFWHPRVQPDIKYGVTFSKKYATELGLDWRNTYIKILDDLGVKNLRLIAYWDEIESNRDIYNFDDVIWQIDEAEKRGVSVILVIGRKVPRYPECFEPKWWQDIKDEELRNFELFEYVKLAANTLKDKKAIKMWQVENEPFFEFGECLHKIKYDVVEKEIDLVKKIDASRSILVQDSGEGGFWYPSYKLGDYLGISMYRKIWYDFWGAFFGNFVYFKYPLAHWTYKIKAEIVRVPYQKIIVTELQAEPWGPVINSALSEEDKNRTMSRHDFLDTISYAQKAGFKDLYLWGVEWWYWEMEMNNNPFYWATAKALFN